MNNLQIIYINPSSCLPTKRGFYGCKNSLDRVTGGRKYKFKLCYKHIEERRIYSYIVTTSSNYSESGCFTFSFTDTDLDIKHRNLPVEFPSYINISKSNQVFEFYHEDELTDLIKTCEHNLIGILKHKIYTRLCLEIGRDNKAKDNFYNTASNDLSILGVKIEDLDRGRTQEEFLSKRKL